MARRPRTTGTARDTYGHEISIGDTVVFSWGGDLNKAIVEQMKFGSMRTGLVVRPLRANGDVCETTANVKDSRSAVKI